jgi:hypothetical protein
MKTLRLTTALAVTFAAACATDSIVGPTPPTQVNFAIPESHGFEDGTSGPYYDPGPLYGVSSYPNDPTGHGMGKVADFHYVGGAGASVDKSLSYTHAIGLSQEIWFQGDFYFATSDLSGSFRKLLYWQGRHDFAKYPNGSGGTSNRVVVLQQDGVFKVDFTHNPGIGRSTHPQTGAPGTGNLIGSGPARQLTADDVRVVSTLLSPAQGNKWYTVKLRVKFESSLGAGDGIVQVWLAERGQPLTQRFSKTNALLTDPLWVGADGDYGATWNNSDPGGQSMEAADIVFENYYVGNQQQGGPFDEHRYWDNIAFSTTDDFSPPSTGVLAEDTFVGTNETQLTSHTPTGTTPGSSWTTAYGEGRDFELENGRVRVDQGGYLKRRDVMNKVGGYPNNYKVSATFVFKKLTGDDFFYVGARTATTGLAGYYFGYETHSSRRWFRLIKGNTADGTTLGTPWSFSYPEGDSVQVDLIVNGTTITGRVNGVDRVVVTDTEYTSAGLPSIYFYGATGPDNFYPVPSGIHLDNFVVRSQ